MDMIACVVNFAPELTGCFGKRITGNGGVRWEGKKIKIKAGDKVNKLTGKGE